MPNSTLNVGKNVVIHPYAKLVHTGTNLTIGDFAQIDDFVFINAGKMCTIGRFTHISSFSSIIGGGEFILEDFAGLSAGCRIITGTDDFSGGFLSNPTVPSKYRNVVSSQVTIRRHAIIGTNAVILPGVTIGEGATVGAGCIVTKDLDPWGIYIGVTARKVGERDREGVLAREAALLVEISESPLMMTRKDNYSEVRPLETEQQLISTQHGKETLMDERFKNWHPPTIEDGKPTKYNWVIQHKAGLTLGHRTDIGAFSYINAKHGVTIEESVQIGSHCSIYTVSTIDSKTGPVVLKHNCRIGSHSTIMPGVTIGENSVIGAHSFVNKDIPANSVAFGVPAKVVRKIGHSGERKK